MCTTWDLENMWSLFYQDLSCGLIPWPIFRDNLYDVLLFFLIDYLFHQFEDVQGVVHLI